MKHPLQDHFDHFKKLKTAQAKIEYLELIRSMISSYDINFDNLIQIYIENAPGPRHHLHP
jgi:hypothetical protein